MTFLSLEALRQSESEAVSLPMFQYDDIDNDQIAAALADPNLCNVNPEIDWEVDHFLYRSTSIADSNKHAYRVAALVVAISTVGLINPIEFDTGHLWDCGFGVPNGHHRVRALQYLGIDTVPFSMCGYTSVIKKVCRGCTVRKSVALRTKVEAHIASAAA